MENEKQVLHERKQPDFEKLLESFKRETVITSELTRKVSFFGHQLKPIEWNKVEDADRKQKEAQGIIDELWDQILYLRRSNEDLNTVAINLESLIGS